MSQIKVGSKSGAVIGIATLLVLFLCTHSARALVSTTLAWNAPTTCEDGSPIGTLLGYRVYYGPSSSNYPYSVTVGNVTTATVAGLQECATYYFVATAIDSSTNESAMSAELIWHTPDATAPTVSGPTQAVVQTDASGYAPAPNLVPQVLVSDACTPTSGITRVQSPLPGTPLTVGTHAVSVTATDASSNHAAWVVTVTVQDHTPPTLSVPASVLLTAGAAGTAPAPNLRLQAQVSDNYTPTQSITIAQSPAAGAALAVGTNAVTVTATDAAGNSVQRSVSVVVNDTTPPVITGPTNVTLVANGAGNAVMPNLTLQVSASDNVTPAPAIALGQSVSAGSSLGIGTQVVTVTATDAAGNAAPWSITVVVKPKPRPLPPSNLRIAAF